MEVFGVKGVGTLIVSFIIYMIDIINEAVVVLVFFMILDVITGLLRSWVTKSWDSTLGFAGVVKKMAIIVMVGMSAAIEFMLISVGQEPKGLIIMGVASFFIVNEGISILENCAQLGLPIPAILFNALHKLHRDPEGKEQHVVRSTVLDRVDKNELMKEREALYLELQRTKRKEDDGNGGNKTEE